MKNKIISSIKFEPEIESQYLHSIYQNVDYTKLVNAAIRRTKEIAVKVKFDAIAFTGTSGAAMAYPLSYKLKIPLICVRKDKSNYQNYSDYDIEGIINAKKYLIVDDFMSSGDTVRRIISKIKERMPIAKPIGILLYNIYPSESRKVQGLPLFFVKKDSRKILKIKI